MDPHRLAELRSLALHRAIAARLAERPEFVEAARRRIDDWHSRGLLATRYHADWARLLARPIAELTASLVEDTERARALRQTTPFVGVIGPRERWALWKSVRAGT